MRNIEQIQRTTERFDSSTFVLFIQYSDYNTSEWRVIKKELSENNLKLKVIKTSKIKKNLKETSYGSLSQAFNGPMAVVLSEENVPFETLIQAVELLNKEDKLHIVGAIYNKTTLFPSKVNELISLPSKEELLAGGMVYLQSVGGLNVIRLVNTALSSQVNVLDQSPQRLVNLLEYKRVTF